jgi:hypothetical protein
MKPHLGLFPIAALFAGLCLTGCESQDFSTFVDYAGAAGGFAGASDLSKKITIGKQALGVYNAVAADTGQPPSGAGSASPVSGSPDRNAQLRSLSGLGVQANDVPASPSSVSLPGWAQTSTEGLPNDVIGKWTTKWANRVIDVEYRADGRSIRRDSFDDGSVSIYHRIWRCPEPGTIKTLIVGWEELLPGGAKTIKDAADFPGSREASISYKLKDGNLVFPVPGYPLEKLVYRRVE